jgi:hypothetical protein
MSVSVELQTLIYNTLIADAGVSALVDGRVYDGRPKGGKYPCITFGPADTIPEDLEGIEASTETVQLDVWSQDGGRLSPCKEIVAAVKDALHLADLSLAVNALVQIRVNGMRVFQDKDGITAHGVITIEADLEES